MKKKSAFNWHVPLNESTIQTFSCAKFAGVAPTVVLMYRVKQESTLSSIEVHLAVEQCWLDQFPIGEPVHISVLWSKDVTLE